MAQQHKHSFSYTVFEHIAELPLPDQQLIEAAQKAAQNAYAPYSRFCVGAAVRLANNEIVVGNNQENASYPAGCCAERVALFQASACYPNTPVLQIAITAHSDVHDTSNPITPCGICRQTLAEYANRQPQPIVVLLCGGNGQVIRVENALDLLPLSFSLK